ncbi:MAG TPA: hypothetical protein VIY48_02035, partial [Candidatus Paceibacterota bacterium]
DQQQQDSPNNYKRFFHGSSILVRPVIIFSETRIGFHDHTVANRRFPLVTQSGTRIGTISNFSVSCLNNTLSATG